MQRFITPLLFFAVAAGVHWYNGQDNGQIMAFPFIELLIPEAKEDLAVRGRVSVWILLGVGSLMTLKSLVSVFGARDEG